MADVFDKLRLLASGEAPVPTPFEGTATWMRLGIEEARELLARLDALGAALRPFVTKQQVYFNEPVVWGCVSEDEFRRAAALLAPAPAKE